jgi:hypothetical protein
VDRAGEFERTDEASDFAEAEAERAVATRAGFRSTIPLTESTETPFGLTRQRAVVPVTVISDLRREPVMMEAMCGGSAATFGFTAVPSIDPAKAPIEDVTEEYEATFPTVGFLLVNDEVLVGCALRTLYFIGRFRVRGFRLLVFGGSLAGK